MIGLTRKTDYALVALAYLGQRRQAGAGSVSARRIADQFGLPLPLLMNILKELTHARIVSSTRGPQGGYALAHEPEAVTLADVIEAMEGPMRLTACSHASGESDCASSQTTSQTPEACGLMSTCPVREPVRRLHTRIHQFFRLTTLADLIDTKVDLTVDQVTTTGATATAGMMTDC